MVVDRVDEEAADVDRIFQALADRTRRDIIARVLRDELSVSAIARPYPMSFAAVQRHVAVLERASLVTKRRRGRERLVRGDPAGLHRAAALLGQVSGRGVTADLRVDLA